MCGGNFMFNGNEEYYANLITIVEDEYLTDDEKEKSTKALEQWNEYVFSLQDIMEQRYLNYIAKEKNAEEERDSFLWAKDNADNNLKEVDLKRSAKKKRNECIEYILSLDDKKCTEQSNYQKNQKNVLFRMLEIFIKDSRKKLKRKDKDGYLFNIDNYNFINNLLDINEEKGERYRAIMDGRLDELDDECVIMLYYGIMELVENETNSLEFKDTKFNDKEFISKMQPHYKELRALLNELEQKVLYYAGSINDIKTNEESINKIKEGLKCFNRLMDKNIEQLDFPDFGCKDLDEFRKWIRSNVGEELKLIRKNEEEEKKKRSERAQRGWETRRERELKKKGEEKS